MNELIKGFTDGLDKGFDKIASAYDIKSEDKDHFIKAASDELELLIRVNGLDKEAGFGSEFVKAFGGANVGKAALGLGASALGGLGAMAVSKVSKSFGSSSNKANFDNALRRVLSESEVLQNNPEKATRLANSIFSFAPKVASDPNVLRNVLDNAIYGDSLDLQTVKAVTDLEEKLNKMDR